MSAQLAASIAITLLRSRDDAVSVRVELEDDCWHEVGRYGETGRCLKVRLSKAEVSSRTEQALYMLALARLPRA